MRSYYNVSNFSMDKINKALNKLNPKEKRELKGLLLKINNGNFQDLDLKKLKRRDEVFRVRKGSMRIIFYKIDNSTKILSVERKTSKTYKKMP